ncbi:uncharacterized protein LOC143622883 [Bidens hawaiensis]|uniref:uncharacterized protein LOC143622883 n=1 Tax=Bidens hawaiensis TaxID=980011 RepID=UPI00404B525A
MASPWISIIICLCLLNLWFFFCFILFAEVLLSAVVTLKSLEIYTTHEWFASSPKVYFKCNGEKKIVLPDVKKKHTVYTFRAEESFQVCNKLILLRILKVQNARGVDFIMRGLLNLMTYLTSGNFVLRIFTLMVVGTFAPITKNSMQRSCVQSVQKKVSSNLTFYDTNNKKWCLVGRPESSDDDRNYDEKENGTKWSMILIISISVVASTVLLIMGLLYAFKIWQKRKRQQEQARFMKLFEDTDDIEDELGIGPLSDSV